MVWLVTVHQLFSVLPMTGAVSCPLKTTPSLFLDCVQPLILEFVPSETHLELFCYPKN